MFKRIIVISGPVGAGKSTLATALTEFGLRVVKTRELLLTMTKTRNDRGGLQAAGERLDARTGGRWIADAMARQAEILPDNAEVIVDSARIRNQIDALRDKFGARVVHVHLTAPVDELARRYKQRGTRSGGEFSSYDEVRANRTEAQRCQTRNAGRHRCGHGPMH
jgi:adenylosuccinate synthase